MKALVCEMCGSQNLLKQDGMYVCQSCGTKYSTEEAKKLLVEGTVKIDNTGSIENYLNMAESAYQSSNQKETENYCNKVIEIDPENYKAWLLKGKAAGWQSTLAKLRMDETLNCFTKAVDSAPEEEKEAVKKEAADEMDKLSLALVTLCCNNYAKYASEKNADEVMASVKLITLYSMQLLVKCGASGSNLKTNISTKINTAVVEGYQNDIVKDYWGVTRHPSENAWMTYRSRSLKAIELLEYAISLNDPKSEANIQIYKNIIFILKEVEPSGAYTVSNGNWIKSPILTQEYKQKLINKMMDCHNKIKEIDPSYVVPAAPKPSSGCYVATAVYGSYDCPEVWTLRRYRDDTLAQTWYGRAFIHTYYAVSPTLVKWFGNTNWFKNMWKPKLNRMVERLNGEGVENTPYEDKNW